MATTPVRNLSVTPLMTAKPAHSHHDQRLAKRLAEDPDLAAEYERQRRTIDAIDSIVRKLDELRISSGRSKAELARTVGTNPASMRRLLTAARNPKLATLVMVADALEADVLLVPRVKGRRRATKRRTSGGPGRASGAA